MVLVPAGRPHRIGGVLPEQGAGRPGTNIRPRIDLGRIDVQDEVQQPIEERRDLGTGVAAAWASPSVDTIDQLIHLRE
jgi:hypothetical protein